MNLRRYPFLFGLFGLAVISSLQSCLPERKVASTFIETPHMISVVVYPPDMVFKYNNKGEEIDGFDSLTQVQQDSALWHNSRYIQYINDSVFLESYINNFLTELRLLGFNAYLEGVDDSVISRQSQTYLLEMSQIQMDEYYYPLEDEDAFLDTIYYKRFSLNAVDVGSWFELSKAGSANARKTLLYASNTAFDTFNGRFFNDPFTGTVRYRYSIDTLNTEDVYLMSGYLGKKYAGYLYDFFLNRYIAKNLPKGEVPLDYYHYNRSRKSIGPADEDRFEILGTR